MARSDELFLAFVLHRRDYSNTSLLVELLIQGQGRVPAIAKGAKRPRNPLSALLQPFQPLWVATSGRGEVLTLTRAEAAERPVRLDGRALISGFYLNELLMRLLGRSDPHDALFADYQQLLPRLAAGGDLDTLLRGFELRLLAELGYAMPLDVEAESGQPVLAERRYRVEPEFGVVLAEEGGGRTLGGETLLALAQGKPLPEPQRREARDLLRSLIEPHLGGRPLETRELYSRWFGDRRLGKPNQPI